MPKSSDMPVSAFLTEASSVAINVVLRQAIAKNLHLIGKWKCDPTMRDNVQTWSNEITEYENAFLELNGYSV